MEIRVFVVRDASILGSTWLVVMPSTAAGISSGVYPLSPGKAAVAVNPSNSRQYVFWLGSGTVSLMLDCETTGIEPYNALTTVKHFADGSEVRRSSRAIVDGLAALGHSTGMIETPASTHSTTATSPMRQDSGAMSGSYFRPRPARVRCRP
jgi:hypothetical protein